ncbi:hypothetical protein RM533_01075 [Croceicoccus sp. F390]|uniref:DUF3606 domain-containing protein n=1 Tax=Croceicoccus esteveae TaxID=3075597 RepID=A0ABU2ZEI5_9SPHN|nr:hypothetical protein [Croceicoccus sp. F390]MDT0574771.1 hypothetical protein [Croceicoccus sp. F390]
MPERQSRHPDNDIIDAAAEQSTPSQQGSAGGNLERKVGKRAEEHNFAAENEVERVLGHDQPAQDAKKGPKTLAKIQADRES